MLRFVYIYMQTSDRSHVITLKAIYGNWTELSRSEFVQAACNNPQKSFSPHYRNADKTIQNKKKNLRGH